MGSGTGETATCQQNDWRPVAHRKRTARVPETNQPRPVFREGGIPILIPVGVNRDY